MLNSGVRHLRYSHINVKNMKYDSRRIEFPVSSLIFFNFLYCQYFCSSTALYIFLAKLELLFFAIICLFIHLLLRVASFLIYVIRMLLQINLDRRSVKVLLQGIDSNPDTNALDEISNLLILSFN